MPGRWACLPFAVGGPPERRNIRGMLLDRDPQLASFAGWVTDAGAGSSSIVLVEGEAGCGKTSLVRSGTEGVGSTRSSLPVGAFDVRRARPLGHA